MNIYMPTDQCSVIYCHCAALSLYASSVEPNTGHLGKDSEMKSDSYIP